LQAPSLALAQQAPGTPELRESEQRAAQETQRQQERERALRERAPEVSLPRPQVPLEGDDSWPDLPCFPIHRIALKGNDTAQFTFLGPALEALQPGTEPVCLGGRGINRVMQQLQNLVVEHGYVTTRVLAEPQDLKTGTLTLTVLAGRVRAIRREGEGSERVTLWNALPTGPGRILDLRDIEQGLENLKRVPTAEADIQVAPADLPGESGLLVRWCQDSPFPASPSVDDSGSDFTGKLQGNPTLSLDHWWTLSDLAYVSFNHDLSQPGYIGQGTRALGVLLGAPGATRCWRRTRAGPALHPVRCADRRSARRLWRQLRRDGRHASAGSSHPGLRRGCRLSQRAGDRGCWRERRHAR
jgi:hemolysin activation/secretion protein